MLVFRSTKVDLPSDLGDLVYINYDPDRIQVAYTRLLLSMFDLGLFSSKPAFERVLHRHLSSLSERVVSGIISHEEFAWALKTAKERMESVEATSREPHAGLDSLRS